MVWLVGWLRSADRGVCVASRRAPIGKPGPGDKPRWAPTAVGWSPLHRMQRSPFMTSSRPLPIALPTCPEGFTSYNDLFQTAENTFRALTDTNYRGIAFCLVMAQRCCLSNDWAEQNCLCYLLTTCFVSKAVVACGDSWQREHAATLQCLNFHSWGSLVSKPQNWKTVWCVHEFECYKKIHDKELNQSLKALNGCCQKKNKKRTICQHWSNFLCTIKQKIFCGCV